MEEDKSLTSEEGQVETEDESTVDTETKTEEHKQEKIEPEKGDNQEILFYVDTMPNNGEENKNQEIKVEVVKNEEEKKVEKKEEEKKDPLKKENFVASILHQNPKYAEFSDSIAYKKEEDSPKLFIGQIPRSKNERDLIKVFSPLGKLYEVKVQREKRTGEHKGCAFVVYEKRSAAEEAMKTIHGTRPFSDARNPIRVVYANEDSEQARKEREKEKIKRKDHKKDKQSEKPRERERDRRGALFSLFFCF